MVVWAELSWQEVRPAVERQPFAMLPFGAVEEHGPHLPLGTDAYAAAGLARLVAERADLIELPVMPYGQVWSLQYFDGSLSVSDVTLVQMITEIAEGLRRSGIRGLVLLSAHLGNAAALKRATRALEELGGLPAIGLTYPGLAAIASEVRDSPESHPAIMHADELETSIMLALDPDRVRMERAAAEYPQYPEHFDVAAVRWDSVSTSGVFGDPTTATAEKGERLVEYVVDAATRIILSWKKEVNS